MKHDIQEVQSAYAPTEEQRVAVARIVRRNVPATEVDDITSMLLGDQ